MIVAALMAMALDGSAEVAKLEWLAGTWVTEKPGVTVREMWLKPLDGVMAGATQTNRNGKARVEFASISAEPDGVTYTARVGLQPPIPFVMKPPAADGAYVFENLTHDFPQRVIYRRCGADLCARVEGKINGKLQGEDWRYTRVP